MGDLATTMIIPAAVKYQNILMENIRGLKEAGLPEGHYINQLTILREIGEHINHISENVAKMIEARKQTNEITDSRKKAITYCDNVKGNYFDLIRYHVDKLELMVDDNFWPLPKYREILFLR